jgi:jumonji domain-containing protein 7
MKPGVTSSGEAQHALSCVMTAVAPHVSAAALLADALAAGTAAAHEFMRPDAVLRVDASGLTKVAFREIISSHKPVVLVNALRQWPAMQWTLDSIAAATAGATMTANYTPTGRADAVHVTDSGRAVFAKPEERQVTVGALVGELRAPETVCGVPYLSFQNDNLRAQAPSLLSGVRLWPWAAAASTLDAVNLWVGDSRSLTSTHKDHYENLYAVLAGRKTFVLLPPCDLPWLYERRYPVAKWAHDAHACCGAAGRSASIGGAVPPCWTLVPQPEEGDIAWITVDPAAIDLAAFPLARHAAPLTVTVGPGEVLYLPSLWFHQVGHQAGEPAVAVNFWFDMEYLGPVYSNFLLVERLSSALHAALATDEAAARKRSEGTMATADDEGQGTTAQQDAPLPGRDGIGIAAAQLAGQP